MGREWARGVRGLPVPCRETVAGLQRRLGSVANLSIRETLEMCQKGRREHYNRETLTSIRYTLAPMRIEWVEKLCAKAGVDHPLAKPHLELTYHKPDFGEDGSASDSSDALG